MIRVDPRQGSGGYCALLQEICGLDTEVELVKMDFGDVSFLGHGDEGLRNQKIGIEVKTVQDLTQSLATGRLTAYQLPGMLRTYDVSYLLVTGWWRPGMRDELEIPRKGGWGPAYGERWSYARLIRSLTSILTKANVPWLRACSKGEGAHMIAALHDWWQTPWHLHSTFKDFHIEPPRGVQVVMPSLLRQIAAQIPEIGWELSFACEETFASVAEMMSAPACVWAELRPPGQTAKGNLRRRLGPTRAARVVAALQERR